MKPNEPKVMTPMKKYRTTINNFKSIVLSSEMDIKEIALNKADSKSIPWAFQKSDSDGYTKGVASDFIMFFRNKHEVSIGLAFEYIGKEEADQKVVCTIKNATLNGGIVGSAPISIVEFKTKLNDFNKLMDTKVERQKLTQKGFLYLVEKFSETFLDTKYDVRAELTARENDITKFLNNANESLKINELEKVTDDAKANLKKHELLVNKKVAALPEQDEKEKLLARIKRLDSIIAEKTIQITKEEKIVERKRLVSDAEKRLSGQKVKLEEMLDDKIVDLPPMLKRTIKASKLK